MSRGEKARALLPSSEPSPRRGPPWIPQAETGREFARPERAEIAGSSPKATADAMAEIILRGLLAD
jgi:hypothetical protein